MGQKKKEIKTCFCRRCGKEYKSKNIKQSKICPDCNKFKVLYTTKIKFINKGPAYRILKALYNLETFYNLDANRGELERSTDTLYPNLVINLKILLGMKLIKFEKRKASSGMIIEYFSPTGKGRFIYEKLKEIEEGLNET